MPNDRTIIFVRANSPGSDETEWNDWYEKQHIAARLEIPGFLCIRRFRLSDGQTSNPASLMAPTYLALYEVDHPDVLSSAPYMKVVKHEASLGSDSFEARTRAQPHIARGIFRQIFPPADAYTVPDEAEWLVAVGHGDLPDRLHREYDAWYNTEHIPACLRMPGVVTARRFEIQATASGASSKVGSNVPDYVALYDVTHDSLLSSELFQQPDSAPWRAVEYCKMNHAYQCIYRGER